MLKKSEKKIRICDHPGCKEEGEFRAPKDRGLEEYYWFCLKHVQEYNKGWNYYEGMSEEEIEYENMQDILQRRPTWRFGSGNFKIFKDIFYGSGKERKGEEFAPNTKEDKAMKFMGIKGSFTLKELKVRYKRLVKEYHPDHHAGDKEKEEGFKKLCESYKVLEESLKGSS